MKLKIKETGEIVELNLYNHNFDEEWFWDFVNGYNHDITYDDDAEAYIISRAEYDWWAERLPQWQEFENLKAELAEEHGWNAVNEAAGLAYANDCEMIPERGVELLKEAFPNHG